MGDFDNFINAEKGSNVGGFADFMQQSAPRERRKQSRSGQITGAEIDELLNGANGNKIRNFFGAVKKYEGGQPNLIVGGKMTFDPNGDHPNKVGLTTAQGSSTAAGDYQITGSNWYKNGLKRRLGAKNFSPENQLRGAVMMFADRENRRGLNALLNDDYETAEKIASLDWAALPSSQLHPKAFNPKKHQEFLKLAGSNNIANSVQATSYLPPVANVPRVDIEAGEPLADVYATADGKRPSNAPPPITKNWTPFPKEQNLSPKQSTSSVPNTFSSFLSEQENIDVNNLGTAEVGKTSFGAEFPNISTNIPETLPVDYQEYLKTAGLSDSQESRNAYSQAVQSVVAQNNPTAEDYNRQVAKWEKQKAETQAFNRQNEENHRRDLAANNANQNNFAESSKPVQQISSPKYVPGTFENFQNSTVGTSLVDLARKPEGVRTNQYLLAEGLKRANLGLSDEEINSYVAENADQNIDDFYDRLEDKDLPQTLNALKNSYGDTNVQISIPQRIVDEIKNRRPDVQQQRVEAERQQVKAETAEREAALRQRAIDEITEENIDDRKIAYDGNGKIIFDETTGKIRPQAPTEDEITQRVEELRRIQLDDEAINRATTVGARNREFGFGGQILSGFYGAAGRAIQSTAGLARPLQSLGISKPYEWLSKTGSEMQLAGQTTNGDSWSGTAADLATGIPFDLARLAFLSKLPGGMVVGFAADHALTSAGKGENSTAIKKSAVKGGAIGATFGVAKPIGEKVAETFGRNAINFVDAFPSNAAYKVANAAKSVVREGTEIAVIGHGTYQIAKAFGSTDEEATAEMLSNTLFHVANKAGRKAFDKVYKIWKDGKEHNVYVNPNGKVRLLKGEVEPNYVDAEIITDPKSEAYRASESAKRIGGKVENEIVENQTNRIGGSLEPQRTLVENNPLRVESADPQMLEKINVDSRAQKVIENIKDGKVITLEQLQKQTRLNKTNLENTVVSLYEARQIEINPDNSIRFIGNETLPQNAGLYDRLKARNESQISSSDPTIEQSAPSVKQSSNKSVQQNSVTENDLPSNANDLSIYEALPQQRTQENITEKPKAEIDFTEEATSIEKQNVFTERGRKAQIAPKVVEQSELLTSLDEGYPPEFQPRDRSRAASKAQISEIAGRLNPEFLGDSPKASDGRPLVVPVTMPDGSTKYAVISGNGRTAGIREAYNLDNDGAKSYKEFAASKGGKDLQQPVYVGVMNPNEVDSFSEFAKEANESATAQMSASEQAKSDADRLDSSVLNLFVPSEDGTIHGAANRDFVRAFLDKTTSTSERNRYIDSEGKLNQEGVSKVKNAIFAKAFGNSEMGMVSLQRMAESTDSNIKNITNALLAKAGELSSFAEAAKDNRRFADADIAPDFARAMEKYSELKESGTSLDEYIRQGALFGADTSPLQTRVMQVFDFYKRRSKSIKSIIDNYIKAAEALGDPNQQSLFGFTAPPSKESIFEAAVKDYEKQDTGEEKQVGLFSPNQGREGEPNSRSQNNDYVGENAETGNKLDRPQFAVSGDNISLKTTREKIFALGVKKLSQNAPSRDVLLAKAKFENRDNAVYLNPEATEYVRQVIGEMFEDSQPAFLGAYLKPEHIEMFKSYLGNGLTGLRPFANNKATKLLQTIVDSADAAHNDTVILSSSAEFPDGLPVARQEELAHRAISRSKSREVLVDLNIEIAPKFENAIEREYNDLTATGKKDELWAKHFRDDAETYFDADETEIKNNLKKLIKGLNEQKVNLEDFAGQVENINQKGKEIADYVRNQRQQYDEQNVRTRTGESNSFTESNAEVRRRRFRDGVQFTERNSDRFTRLRQTENFGSNRSGNESLAVRLKNEILFDRVSDTNIDVEETAAEAERSTKTLLSYIYDGKRDVSPTEAAMNILRTGYLAGLSVIKTNLIGNSSNIVVEQIAKPLMATADILNPKAKTRTTPGLSPRDIIEGFFGKDGFFRAGFIGDKGVVTALVKGVDHQESARVDMNIADKNTNFVRNTGVPLIDVIIEATKRLVTGVDRPFKAYARSAEKSGLARLEASKENLTKLQWRRRVSQLKNDPTTLINDVAERYAETVTFQNPNAVTQTYDKFRRFLIDEKAQSRLIPTATQRKIAKYVGSATYLATGQVAPFMSTPSNVGFRTLEYFFPTGAVIAAAKFYRIGKSFERRNFVEEEALNRAKIIKRLAAVRGLQDRKFNAETNEKKKRLDEQKKLKNEAFKREIESVKNSKVFTDAAKNARIEQLKSNRDKWLEGWEKNRDKYLQTRTEAADKATAGRKVVDEIQKKNWESEDAYADLKFSMFENRSFAEAAGRAGFGATVGSLTLLAVIYGIIKAVGTTDDDEKEKSKEKRASGIPDDTISIFGYRFPYADNPFGNALKMGINLFEQYERPGNGYDRASAMAKRFGKDVTSLNPLTDQGFTRKDWASYAGSKANSMTPILNLKILQELGEVLDDKPRKYWEEGFAAQYLIKMPKLREYLPESESFIGGTEERGGLGRRVLRAVDPLKTTREQIDQSELPNVPVTRNKETEPSKDKRLDNEVRKGRMSVEDAENVLTDDLTNGDISSKQYKQRITGLSDSKAVQQLSDTDANKEQDFAAIEGILKNANEADKPQLEKILLDKAKKKLNSKTNKGIDEGERLFEIYDRYFSK